MRKLLVVAPLLLVLGIGCDSTRRDFTYCDQKYHDCLKGFTCDQTGLCVPETDAGAPDAMRGDDGLKSDVAPSIDIGSDTNDAPVVLDVNVIDTSIVDVNQPVDLSTPDLRVPDAAGTCSVDNDCTGLAAGAYCVNNRCVACKTSSQCNNAAGKPFCSAENTCVSCASAGSIDGGVGVGSIDGGVSAVCSGTIPVCNSATGSCVQCVKNTDCPSASKAFCVQNQCVGCDTSGASAGGVDGGVADAGTGATACTGTKPVCVPGANGGPKAGQCVACNGNSNCSGNTPICDMTTYTCQPCTSDSQCPTAPGISPGVCMLHSGGRCATDAETIYVNNDADCPKSYSTGSSDHPFCQLQSGVNAVKTDKRVILVKGVFALLPVSANLGTGAPQVSIIGQNNPIILVGAASAGIELISGNLYIRGLTVQGAGNGSANGLGIQIDSTASFIGLDRCRILGNAGGLLVNAGVNFDINNSVFAANTSGQVNTTTFFGGVYLGGSAPAGLSQFRFNTIYNNSDRGVICADPTQKLTGIFAYLNQGGDYASCVMDKTSVWGNGKTAPDNTTSYGNSASTDVSLITSDVSYHLTAANHCRDHVDPTVSHPSDDIDGDSRPYPANGMLDCGADEYQP